MKIKIIDLLVKVANGEEVPKKIMYDDVIYTDDGYHTYYDDKDNVLWSTYNFLILNDEVEIIEEDKKNGGINDNELLARIGLLEKENQELKSQLSGTTHCFDEDEHRKLKEEIKKLERIIELCHLDAKETLATINYEQESQQKAFINYLQRGINHYTAYVEAMDSAGPSIYSNEYDNSKIKIAIYKGILQKYKEIVNGSKQN